MDSLPSNYRAPKNVDLFGNTLRNVKIIISINGVVPILVGDGKKPRIWIQAPSNAEGTEWYPLIRDNLSSVPQILVLGNDKTTKISTPNGVILEAEKCNDGSISIKKFDLRPFGINIYGEKDSFYFLNNAFKKSTFNNVETMFSVG